MNQKLKDALLRMTRLMAVLAVLFACVMPCTYAAAATEAELDDYASLTVELAADASGTPLPDYVENGQSIFFRMKMSGFDSEALVAFLKANSPADLTVGMDFIDYIDGAYPTELYPDNFDNVAEYQGKPMFRWWIEDGKIRIRFDDEWVAAANHNTVLETAELGLSGVLNVQNKLEDGKLTFQAAGVYFPLQMKAGYAISKTAGVPYYSTDAASYLADYTVTLTLDQDVKLSSGADADLYEAALTLVDTVDAAGALQGTIFGDATVTAPAGETAAAVLSASGAANTLTLTSPDQVLKKGSYAITYKMKIRPEAAAARLEGYTDAQKTNTVELKENGASLKTPLTATAAIAWDKVTENQYKIDKTVFTDQGAGYSGVYLDEANQKYYLDYRVVVYIREPVQTFTVADAPQYGFSLRNDVPITLEGVDTAEDYWTNDMGAAALSACTATVTTETQRLALGHNGAMADCAVITITAPEGQLLQPGAYHLRIPADVTAAVQSTLKKDYPQYYSNMAYLTSVDGVPTGEKKEYKQAIPKYSEPSKGGGFEADAVTGEFLFYEGKPVIRWDVYFGWNFYGSTTFVDTLTGMELLVNNDYPFEIHSFEDSNHFKETLASLKSVTDTSYLDFSADGTGFTFGSDNLDTNADGTPVRLYKFVYFTTPVDDDSETGYQSSGLKNGYVITHTDHYGNGFGTGPVPGEREPTISGRARLYVKKNHVIERNDSLTQWKITCDNTTNKIPFARFDDLDIIDLVPLGQTPIGEVNIHYGDDYPITVEMVCSNNAKVQLVEGTHYSIVKQHPAFDFGENGRYGFAVDLNMEAVAAVLAEKNAAYFKTIDVLCYLENEKHPSGRNYRISNDGWLYYSNQGQEITEGTNAYYDRGFATKKKLAPAYGDYYDPSAGRNFTVCTVNDNSAQSFSGGYDDNPANGDGNEEILWKIFIGAREFGTDNDPITVTVTDTLSDNQMFPSYPGKSLADLFLIEAEDNPGYIILPDSVSLSGSTFTLTFTVPGGGWAGGNKDKSKDLYITYHTVLKKEALQEALDNAAGDAGDIVIEYSNTASAGWNGDGSTIPTSTGSHSISTAMLDKKSSFLQSAGNKVSYTIEMNTYGLDMASDDVLRLEDAMGEGKEEFLYLQDTFRLYNAETGARLAPGSSASANTYVLNFAGDGKSFTLDVPDNTPLRLTYQVKTTKPVGTQDVRLQNTASLEGRTVTPVEITFDVNSSYQSGSFSVEDDEVGIRIFKIDSRDVNMSAPDGLSGAKFSVTTIDISGNPLGEPVIYTTDADGVITFLEKINVAKIILVEETQAPAGYMLDETPWQWCYVLLPYGMAISDSELAALTEATGCNVSVVTAGTYAEEQVPNDPVSVTIVKKNGEGETLYGAEFTLIDASGNTISPDQDSLAGTATFSGLTSGSYTLTETKAPNGYRLSDENSWSFTVAEDGTVSLPADAAYTLLSLDGGKLTVVNEEYTASITFEGTKTIVGREMTEADVFTFEIVEGDTVIATATNDAEGKISYPQIDYTMADVGEHTYIIRETSQSSSGVKVDDTVYTVTVNVNDNGDGTLAVEATDNYTALDFTNTALGGFKFTKRNVTGAALPGAVFGVYSEEACTTKLRELTTDKYGEASLTGLEAGKTYYIQEITAPDGYELNETVYSVTIEADVENKPVGETGVIINERNTIDLCVRKNWHNAEGDIENNKLGVDVSGALELYILSADGTQTLVEGTDGNALRPEFEDGKGEEESDLYWWRNMPILPDGDQYIVKEDLSKVPAGVVVHYNSDPEGTKGYEISDSGDFSVYNSYFKGFEIFMANKKVDGQYVEDTFAFELVDAKTGEVVAKENSSYGPDFFAGLNPDVSYDPEDQSNWVNQVMLQVDYDMDDLPTTVDGLTEYEYILREVDAGGNYIYDIAEYEYKVTIDRMGKTKVYIKADGEYQPYDPFEKVPVFENKAAVSISGTKVWADNNNAGGTRPEEITIWLYADSEKTDKSVTLKSGETEWSFTGLPKYAADGREIIYTADESDVPEGYVRTVTGDAASGFVITNALKQGEGALEFTKILSFGDFVAPEGYTFTFTLTPDENTPDTYTLADNAYLPEDATSITPVVEDGKVVGYTLERTLNAYDLVNMLQAWSTLKFTFTETGTYTFTLQEKAPDPIPDGWSYDTTPYTIQYVVTEGETELEVENKNESAAPEIRNELKTTETAVYKYWKDSGYEEDRLDTTELPEYLYLRYSTDNGATWTDYGKLAELQTQKNISVVVEDWGSGMWFINVKNLPVYIGGKTAQWSFVEKLPEGSPYETVYGAANNCDATAGLTGTDADHICIYNIHEIEVVFEGSKTLTGKTLAAGDFSFQLIDADGTVIETVKNDADGNFSFSTIKYSMADIGEYTYTVKEVNDGKPGVKYDTTEYQVNVVIKDAGAGDGTLIAEVSPESTALDFVNAYEAKGEITFEGTKTIEGREWREDDIYNFEVCEEGRYTAEVNNDLTGKINYPTIEYTHLDVGEHEYTIREIREDGNGLTFDETEYAVKVKVTDNGDGTLTVEATGDDHTALDFTNTYATEGSIQFSGVKTLYGKDLVGDDFSFQLIGEDGNVIETVTNDAYGKFAFSAIEYDQADAGKIFTYTVQEVNDGKSGITYDSNVYTVTVTVVDNGYGTLTVIPSISESNMNFTNTYEAEGEITFEGTKTIEGRDMTATDVFTFSLMEGEIEIATVTNDADGNIVFPTIEYHLYDVGEHSYTIREISEDGNGITVDDTVYTVTVEVADNGDGTLAVEATGADHTKLDFTNTYEAVGEITFSATKTLTGKALAGDDFSFELLNEDGTVIETVTNDADGNIVFPTIEYTLDDVGTHTYTVQEVNDEQPGVGYDPTIYTVTVIVEDNGDGTLYVTADLDHEALNFVNTYEAEGKITFSGTKTIEGRAMTENDVFVFDVMEGEKTIVTASNDADGNIVFPTIEYTLDDVGTHTYTVKETSPSGLGITADPTEYTVTVEVKDAGDGTLTVTASDTATALNFTNTYAAEGKITFAGVKTIEGRALTANDKFTFEIKEGEKTIATVTNDADGKIAYPTIEYTLADVGTHTYTVKETSENGNGITVDTTEYTVVVTVIDAGHGTLDVMADVDHTALNFTNTYEATGEIVLDGTKTLVGRELAAGEFEFELIDEAGEVAATATNDAEGQITFTKLTYTTADIGKTYTYTAKEVTGNLPGVTYDAAPITVKVAITDNGDGTLNVVKTADSADIAFTNTYSAEGAILLAGTKSLTGRTLKADEFSFELYDANGELLQTVTNDAKGAFAFEEIKYELADAGKTFTYTVKEKSGTLPGVTYDDAVITVEVKVEDVGGKLTATLTQNSEAIAFTNTYEAVGEITFEGTKTIEGRAMTADDLFTFEVKEGNDVLGLAMNDATGKIAYPTIKYTLNDVGTHTYTVRETNTDGDGLTVDTTVYTVTVEVKDAGDGTLTVTASDNATALDFTNTYAADGSVQFAGSKTLTGKALAAEDFSFELIAKDGTVIETVKNDANGKFTFTAIKYDLADVGEHTYTVKEVNDKQAGVTYDETVYTVTVEVKDAGDGTLTVTASDNAIALDFTNTYAADGSVQFAGTKTLSGKALEAEDFSFELIAEDGNVIETVKNDADGKFTFTAIKYELDDIGEHTYTVKEVNDKQAGITYDETVYTVTVEVKDAGDGTLTVTASDNATALDFTNTYAADGSVQFGGFKTLTGKALAAEDFSFELIAEDGTVIETVKNDANGKFTFTAIKYELADIGTHTYTVKEVNDKQAGITYDETVYTVTVEVKDAGNGTLTVTASDNATVLDFTNTYAADGSVQFAGSKTLTGKALAADDFSFELIGEDGTVIETVKNDADGEFAFTAIKYELADIGTHTYTVKEVNDGKAGITYDATVYTVTVTVADAGNGTLTVTASDNATALDFTNTYAADGSVQFAGSKTLTGKALAADDFSFELIGEDGNVIETVKNDADGKFTFTAIKYDLADVGTHTYTVKEVNDGKAGVTYDATEYEVTVEVKDAGDGTLTVTASDNATALDFTNTYAADGSVQFAGTKTLTGKALAAEDFSFELIDENGTVIETVKNDADGKFAFTAIKYDLDDIGEHTYTVKEVNDKQAGVTYDETVYTVTVEVKDAGDGTLKVEASDNATALDFVNEYAADGSVQFAGTKTLTGKALAAEDFSFELIGEDGTVIETVKNDANGKFAFTAIKYDLDDIGEHTYTVKEVNDGKAGVTYDATEYEVTVTVADAGDGTLTVTASDNATALDFTNTYAADGSVQFAGTKTLTGKALAAEDFSFELIDENGTVIETVKNDANGKFAFTAIKYELDDIGTHTYTVKEVNDGRAGITYDATEYEVTVTVADGGDGTLTVTASDNATALDFTNTYAADGSVQFGGTKTLTGKALAAEDFSFELIDENGSVIETVKNDADGKFTFTAIKYELIDIGTHTYTVKEVNDGKSGITYDATEYEVTVTVADAGNGTLTVTASDNATALDFVNEYIANGALELSGTKTLTGKELEAGMFSFELIDAEGNVIETVENDAEGKFSFTAIGYTLADDGQSYTYKVREAAGNSAGVIYDGTIYTVKVEIADNGDGTLTVDPVISRLGEVVTGISFNNIMEAPLTISKKVVGCETDEKFAITVRFYHADGTEVTEPVAYTGDLTGEVISGRMVRLSHGQSITFTGLLPGMLYTVEELANAAYETTVNTLPMSKVDGVCTEGGNRADFVNTLISTTFTVRKAWQGEDGGVIRLTLYANGEKLDPQPEYTREGDTYSYTGLPKYNADGDLIVYAAKEKYMDGYLTIYDNVPPYDGESDMIYDGGTIINRSVMSIRVRKVWSGLPEGMETPEIILTLYCNGEPMDRKQPKPDADGWYVYKNLPRYVNGEEPLYYVVEEAADGFMPVYTDANGQRAEWAGDGYTITNSLIPATGDNSPLALWGVMFTASAAVLVLMFRRRRKAN